MYARHRVSRAAIDLLKRFEGYRQTAAQLPDGRWTIGHGHTLTAREGAVVSASDAEALLLYDLITVAHVVNENAFTPLNQNQFDALCSFVFNIGVDNFRRSQMLKRLNAGETVQAGCAMELWRKADFEGERIVIDALVRRRAAEKALFLTPPDDAWTPAPSPLLRPVLDLDALDLVPLQRPVEVTTRLEGDQIIAQRDGVREAVVASESPAPATTAAAEAVSGRLSAIFADPGEEPDWTLASPVVEDEALEPDLILEHPVPTPDVPDDDLDIPKTPFPDQRLSGSTPNVSVEMAPFEFIPARTRPAPRRNQRSVVWDLLLALLGLAFFGFAIFWGLNTVGSAMGGLVTPLRVAWLAGVAGVGFLAVAVFRLLQRLGQAAERD
jgi:lysozyme